jgi:hypothetical protein
MHTTPSHHHATIRPARPRRWPRALSIRLEREWEVLRHRPAAVARARSWGVTATPFTSLDELLWLAGFWSVRSTEADRVLGALVDVAGRGDQLAARVVLQRLLPGLLAIVRREQFREPGLDAFELLAAEAWIAISGYDVGRRPTHIAARLLNDARHRAFTTPRRRRRRIDEVPVPPGHLDGPMPAEPGSTFEELTTVVAVARDGGLTDRDLVPVRDYLSDHPARAAAQRGITLRTLRNRRDRSVARIRYCAA